MFSLFPVTRRSQFSSSVRRISSSSHNALRLNYIIFFLSRDHSLAMDFIEVVPQNNSGISRKKAYLCPLLRSWNTGKRSVRTIYLSSSEISSWPRQFPWENRRTKDVRVFISEESDRCSEGSPISSPFGSDIKISFSAFHSLVFGLAFDCSFIVYSTFNEFILRSLNVSEAYFHCFSPHMHRSRSK